VIQDRSMNRFEFVALASQRAKQLIRGCTPRVESLVDAEEKPITLATREIATGAVERVDGPA